MKLLGKILATFALSVPMMVSAGPLVNINTADVYEMVSDLNGVNETTAEAIVDYRDKNGPFATLEGLLEVEGVDRDTLNMNRNILHLGHDPELNKRS